jgi:hypothetical protein
VSAKPLANALAEAPHAGKREMHGAPNRIGQELRTHDGRGCPIGPMTWVLRSFDRSPIALQSDCVAAAAKPTLGSGERQ